MNEEPTGEEMEIKKLISNRGTKQQQKNKQKQERKEQQVRKRQLNVKSFQIEFLSHFHAPHFNLCLLQA